MPDFISDVEILNNVHDIASYVKNCSLHDSEIIACLKFIWEPPVNYVFPVQFEGNRISKFQHKYLQLFPWLTYNKKKNKELFINGALFLQFQVEE